MPLNIPNILTLGRIISIPFFIAAYLFLDAELKHITTTVIFVVAALTDTLDGFLARRLGMASPFGAFLDPIADKLMVCVALVLIVSDHTVMERTLFDAGFILATVIIVGREVSVAALREWMAELGSHAKMATTWLSKIKTVVQMCAIVMILYGSMVDTPIADIYTFRMGEILLYISAVLTLWTMTDYLRIAWPSLIGEQDE